MARIGRREPGRSALLVVDMQKGVVATAYRRDEVVANIARLVDRARAANVPVVWVLQGDDELPPGSDAWQIVGELRPAPGEAIIGKAHNSAFEETGLDETLGKLGATRIVLAGAATNWCIRATAHAALDRGYDLCLVGDAHTTEDLDLDDGRRIEAAALIAELNVAMAWMSYPGRKNETVTTDACAFA